MKRITAIAAFAWALCAAASAQQQPSPIVQHYRAYQAALEANDLATAETEAAAALAASEARDGEGGRTGVLALNLATVRLQRNDSAGAVAPVRRALAQAEARGEASGVPLALARLIVARTELASGDATAGERLATALTVAQQERLSAAEIYDGAFQLGVWAFTQERYDLSRNAWAMAASHAQGSRLPPALALGQARTGEAASLLLGSVADQRRDAPFDPAAAAEAQQILVDAEDMLYPFAQTTADGGITFGLRAYGEARAWTAALRAKMLADGQPVQTVRMSRAGADGLIELGLSRDNAPNPVRRCFLNVELRDGPSLYPEDAARRSRVAGVVMLLRTNENGEVVSVQPVAQIGSPAFAEALSQPDVWRVSRRDDSPANCRMEMYAIRALSFTLPPQQQQPQRRHGSRAVN